MTVLNVPPPVRDEPRSVEFELCAPANAAAGSVQVFGYALYGVCEGLGGVCL